MRTLFIYIFTFSTPLSMIAQVNKKAEVIEQSTALFGDLKQSALDAKKSGRLKFADSAAKVYKSNYLDLLGDSSLITRETFEFVTNFPDLIHSRDRIFRFCYDHLILTDELVGGRKGYTRDLVKYIIRKELVDTFLYKNQNVLTLRPNWKRMHRKIKKKYGRDYADEIILESKMTFYRRIENWMEFGSLFDQNVRHNHPSRTSNLLGGSFGDAWTLNSTAWDIFLNCNDKVVLKKALTWVCLGMNFCDTDTDKVQYLDTEANILYKLGNSNSAIGYEEKAVSLERENREMQLTLAKMKLGIPTWPTK